MENKKEYSADQLILNQYYNKGTGVIVQFLGDTGEKIESFKDHWSNVYKFRVFDYASHTEFEHQEMVLNPKWVCFTDVDTTFLESRIEHLKERGEKLKLVLNEIKAVCDGGMSNF